MVFDVLTGMLILACLFSYLNARFFQVQPMIGFMIGAFLFSLVLLGLSSLGIPIAKQFIELFSQVDFENTVLYQILSFLLFAGAIQTNVEEMRSEKWMILVLSSLSVIISTFVVGTLSFAVFQFLGFSISYIYCLVFGALISPTDPVIVLGILKKTLMSRSLRVKIVGESLFNDGIAIVLFVILLGFAKFHQEIGVIDVMLLTVKQLVGSLFLGLFFGWLIRKLLHKISDFNAQVFITLGVVAGSYDLALYLGVSGPITVVIAGLFFRNYRGKDCLPEHAYQDLYGFWALVDELLNAVLFILMGLEVLAFRFHFPFILAGGAAICIVLFGRYISVLLPLQVFSVFRTVAEDAVKVLTWAGLRGGISLALALSLTGGDPAYDLIAFVTYSVVIFSLTVQVFVLHRLLKE